MDVCFEDHGSIWLVNALSEAALIWINDNVGDDTQWFGGALVVEPRYVPDLCHGMAADGLVVEVPSGAAK